MEMEEPSNSALSGVCSVTGAQCLADKQTKMIGSRILECLVKCEHVNNSLDIENIGKLCVKEVDPRDIFHTVGPCSKDKVINECIKISSLVDLELEYRRMVKNIREEQKVRERHINALKAPLIVKERARSESCQMYVDGLEGCIGWFDSMVLACTQLNGNNGEWTNGDDMGGKGKKAIDKKQDKKIAKLEVKINKKNRNPRGTIIDKRRKTFASKKTLTRYESHYITAVKQPFATTADGVKVPDEYEQPTLTRKLRIQATMSSGSNYVGGNNATFIFFPNPYLTLIDASTANGSQQNVMAFTGFTPYATNTALYRINTPTQDSQYLGRRPVVGAIKVRSQMATNVPAGVVTMTPLIVTGKPPPIGVLSGNAMNATNGMSALLNAIFGGTGTGLQQFIAGGGLVNLPGSVQMTTYDLLEKAVILRFRGNSPAAQNFNATQEQGTTVDDIFTTGELQADWVSWNTASGAITKAGNNEDGSCLGWTAWVVQIRGANNSTNLLDLDYVLHDECQPMVTTSTGTNGTSCPTSITETKSSGSFENVAAFINKSIPVVEAMSGAIGAAIKGMGNGPVDHLARTAAGLLTNY
jgi:hypothetical protein